MGFRESGGIPGGISGGIPKPTNNFQALETWWKKRQWSQTSYRTQKSVKSNDGLCVNILSDRSLTWKLQIKSNNDNTKPKNIWNQDNWLPNINSYVYHIVSTEISKNANKKQNELKTLQLKDFKFSGPQNEAGQRTLWSRCPLLKFLILAKFVAIFFTRNDGWKTSQESPDLQDTPGGNPYYRFYSHQNMNWLICLYCFFLTI